MVKSQVTISLQGEKKITFLTRFEPHSEKDLLRNPEYVNFYYSVGLGAPLTVEVSTRQSLFKVNKYSFSFAVRGNSISWEELMRKVDTTKAKHKCESMKVSDEMTTVVYSFLSYQDSYSFYSKFDKTCNIGAYHYSENNKFIVKLEYYPIDGDDSYQNVIAKVTSCDVIWEKLFSGIDGRYYELVVPENSDKLYSFESSFYTWNQKNVLEYFSNLGQLNSKSDYGQAEQLIAFNSVYGGIYLSQMAKENAITEEFYLSMLGDKEINDLDIATLEKIGIPYESERDDNLFQAIKSIMPIAASFSNKVESADQIREVCYALFRIGICLGYSNI